MGRGAGVGAFSSIELDLRTRGLGDGFGLGNGFTIAGLLLLWAADWPLPTTLGDAGSSIVDASIVRGILVTGGPNLVIGLIVSSLPIVVRLAVGLSETRGGGTLAPANQSCTPIPGCVPGVSGYTSAWYSR